MRDTYARRTAPRAGLHAGCSSIFLLLMTVMILAPAGDVQAGELGLGSELTEEGGVREHERFAFEAFITYDDIRDGTAPFDADNAPGNDAAATNQVVRSFDTVTYPLKVTVNPKGVDKLENIRLKLTGTLAGGISDGRVHASFAVGGTEDLASETVSFTQFYTIEQTGNSVMIPVAVNVQGAADGVTLTPELRVEVVSIDGETVTGVRTDFTSLPGVTVSAKVNIQPFVGEGLTGKGIPYYPLSGITGDESERANTHAFAVSWSAAKLPGKPDLRGATLPDPAGEVHYRIELDGHVAWDEPGVRTDSVDFDFAKTDTPFLLYDAQPIESATQKIGAPFLLADGLPYEYRYSLAYAAPLSAMADFEPSTVARQRGYAVWDSGEWSLSAPQVASDKVVYHGVNTGFVLGSTFPSYRADGFTGERLYDAETRVFASNGFIVKMPNEYRIAGPLNPEGLANNTGYRARVVLEHYTAPDGTTVTLNKADSLEFTERNLPDGSYSVQNTFKAYPSGKELGTPYAGWDVVSKGDASTLVGEDVFFEASLGSNVISYGGYQAVYRWNTDAFELTENYAATAAENLMQAGYITPTLDRVRNNAERQFIRYGVPLFSDNGFESFTQKGIDDYTWFDDFADAATAGSVGAIQVDVTAPIGAKWQASGQMPLKVRHDNIGIGASTKEGTPNIAVTNFYPYVQAERDGGKNRVDVARDRSYHNPAIWSDAGVLVKRQSPYGETVNFETLAVLPATVSSKLTAEKDSYYASETIRWQASSSLRLPESGLPDGFDGSVTLTQVLPPALLYQSGSGEIGGVPTEPEITQRSDGSTELRWELLVHTGGTVDDVAFATAINPLALDFEGVHGGLTVESVTASPLDGRPAHLRTSRETVTVLKVGMVGIFETIDQTHGGKNSAFTVTLTPYTTVDDERDVTGLTHIPLSGDAAGSVYTGDVVMSALQVTAERRDDEPVRVYLNNRPIYSDRPHEIDVTTDGWYEYTDGQDVSDAVSLLFRVDGEMTRSDTIRLSLTLQTSGNAFGDTYLNETVINSATDYQLSPVSNRVRYTIRPAWEVELERLRIYTDLADRGLPVSVRVKQTVLDAERASGETVTLALYDTESGERVAHQTFTQAELMRETELMVPPGSTVAGDQRRYEVRLEGADESVVWVKRESLDTDGYTAREGTLTAADRDESGAVVFRGVVMTERERGSDIAVYHETIGVTPILDAKVKSGYGFAFEAGVAYANSIASDSLGRTDALTQTGAALSVDTDLVDTSLAYHDGDAAESLVPLLSEPVSVFGVSGMRYQLPQVFLAPETGAFHMLDELDSMDAGRVLDAGHKLYVPVWVPRTGVYTTAFRTLEPLGVHRMTIDLARPVEVYAYMFHHADTETSDLDELLVGPMPQGDIAAAFGE